MTQPRILFVDDEPMVLSGLKRSMRPYRDKYSLDFVSSGEEALEAMQRTAYSIIISDMLMPKMDGAQLLHKVQSLHPETIRFILSGEASKTQIMRCVMLAHQYLSKPCSPDMIIDAIDSALTFINNIKPNLKSPMINLAQLPSLPTTYQAIMEKLSEPKVTIQDIASIIEQDVAMCSKILHLINSAFFGLPSETKSIRDAVTLLGLDIIMGLILQHGILSQIPHNLSTQYDISKANEACLIAAKYALKMAHLVPDEVPVHANACYTATLLSQVGQLCMIVTSAESYADFYEAKQQSKQTTEAVEIAYFGHSLRQIGCYLMYLWGLPTHAIVASLDSTRDPATTAKLSTEAVVVHCAELLQQAEDRDWMAAQLTSHPWFKKSFPASIHSKILKLKYE